MGKTERDLSSKQMLREKARNRRNQVKGEDRERISAEILNRYYGLSFYEQADLILAYRSFGKELNMDLLIERAMQDGKRVGVPRVIGNAGALRREPVMEFVIVSQELGWTQGSFGIWEPINGEVWMPQEGRGEKAEAGGALENVELILPGLCFDFWGGRIGYGGGYYDWYLKQHGASLIHKTALAYDFQVYERLPCTSHDVPFDCLVTEARYFVL